MDDIRKLNYLSTLMNWEINYNYSFFKIIFIYSLIRIEVYSLESSIISY